MKKFLLYFSVFFFLFKNTSYSEIYFIDFEKIINQSEPGIFINNTIKESNIKNDEQFKQKRDKLKKQEQTLISQKNILNEKEFNSKLDKLKSDVENFNIENKQRLDEQQKKLINYKRKLIQLIEPILIDYMKENNISYLLRKQNILVGRDDFNKTNEIMNLINQKINIENLNE